MVLGIEVTIVVRLRPFIPTRADGFLCYHVILPENGGEMFIRAMSAGLRLCEAFADE